MLLCVQANVLCTDSGIGPCVIAPPAIADDYSNLDSNFQIKLINFGVTPAFIPYFEAARTRWQQIIIGDVLDYATADLPLNGQGWFDGNFGDAGDYFGDIDDIVIG
jgi:hypothetical protein